MPPCPIFTRARSGRCDLHAKSESERQHNALYDTPVWSKTRRSMIEAHLARHGWWCPGVPEKGIEPHTIPPQDRKRNPLTLDHILALALGGAPTDRANLQVLCKRCNEAKDAALAATFSRPQR